MDIKPVRSSGLSLELTQEQSPRQQICNAAWVTKLKYQHHRVVENQYITYVWLALWDTNSVTDVLVAEDKQVSAGE